MLQKNNCCWLIGISEKSLSQILFCFVSYSWIWCMKCAHFVICTSLCSEIMSVLNIAAMPNLWGCCLHNDNVSFWYNANIFAKTSKWIFLNGNIWISIEYSLKFVAKGPINNIPALVQIMPWRRPGDKSLSETMLIQFTDAYMRH